MRGMFAVAACAACATEAPVPIDPPQPPSSNGRFVSATTIETTVGPTTVSIPATSEGDQIYILLTGDAEPVHQVLAGPHNVSLELGAIMPDGCDRWAWTWKSADVSAGIESLQVIVSATAAFSGHALVFGGLYEDGFNQQSEFRRASSAPATAPAMRAGAGNVVLSFVGTCGSVGELVEPTVFTTLPGHDGIDIAYLIPTEPGEYGAEWTSAGDSYVAVTRVLR
jgi:hypothetical protein